MTRLRRMWIRLYFRFHRFERLVNRRLSPVEAVIERRLLDNAPVVDLGLPEPRRNYRVLLPVSNPEFAARLARFAAAAAATRNGEVVVLYIERPSERGRHTNSSPAPRREEPGTSAEPPRVPQRWSVVKCALDSIHEAGVPSGYVVRESANVGRGIRREARRQDVDLIVMGWRGASPCPEGDVDADCDPLEPSEAAGAAGADATLDVVLEDPPCDVMVLGGQGDALPARILVPFVTSNDTPIALRLAQALTRDGGSVTALRVMPDDSTMAAVEAEGQRFGEKLHRYGAGDVSQLIIRANDRVSGILEAVRRGYDGVLMAAPPETFLDHLLFGNTQMAVASRGEVPVMVVKRRSGALTFVARRLWRSVYDRLPKLTLEERETVTAEIDAAAAPRADFFIMIALSSAIAAFGLLLNSPAVIIGAMLVAPLMSAIVGMGLGVVEGRPALLRQAASAALRGAALALAVSIVIGLFQIGREPGPEIVSRIRPTLLDLGVALASGAAGAYAVSRKGVQTALAGVAIAAALVPPLAAAGIGLAILRIDIAVGALLLYFTNLVAIAAAGGVVFLLLGFGPREDEEEGRRLLQQGFRTAAGLLIVVVAALAFITWQTFELYSVERLEREVESAVRAELDAIPGADLTAIRIEEEEDDVLLVDAIVRLPSAMVSGLDYNVAMQIQDGLAEALDRTVKLDVSLIPTVQLQPRPPPDVTPEAAENSQP